MDATIIDAPSSTKNPDKRRDPEMHQTHKGKRKLMKLSVDKEADALHLRLDDSPVIHSEEVSPGVVLDYNESNDVVGVEMLRLSQRSSNLNLSDLQFEVTTPPP